MVLKHGYLALALSLQEAATAEPDKFKEKLNANFVKKAIISNEIKEKDLDPFKEGTNTALTLGAGKSADVVVMGADKMDKKVVDELKPSRYKKVLKYETGWKEDVSPLLELYKSLTES